MEGNWRLAALGAIAFVKKLECSLGVSCSLALKLKPVLTYIKSIKVQHSVRRSKMTLCSFLQSECTLPPLLQNTRGLFLL